MLFNVFKMKRYLPIIALLLALSGCASEPEQVAPINGNINPQNSSSTGIFTNTPAPSNEAPSSTPTKGHHHVISKELLETEKYTYIKVTENNKEFWVATLKGDYAVGQEYVFNGGLLKTKFKSIEHDRIFDELYLVSELTSSDHESHNAEQPQVKVETPKTSTTESKGAVSIQEITTNPEKFVNQTVTIYGEITKVNPNIMGTNWHHIKDGSADDYDFVVTSSSTVPVGHKIGFQGLVTTNKDFGAGYKYNIIMENATALK
tara:strand:+ start:6432 stop:7214 length:783 start_codon:yes stop_codon:yes gene_type:complete